MKDCTEGKLVETLAIATKNSNTTLDDCIKRLKNAEEHLGVETFVYTDFAPLSFYFERKDAPESTYQTDLVTDDLLEAVRVTSKIAKATFLIFNEPDTMCVCCATNKASYYKKILCESKSRPFWVQT